MFDARSTGSVNGGFVDLDHASESQLIAKKAENEEEKGSRERKE